MAGGTPVDPEELSRRIHKFMDAPDKFDTAFNKLEKTRATEHNKWGQDKPGKEFKKEYTKAVKDSNAERDEIVKGLRGIHDELAGSASQRQADDENSARSMMTVFAA